MVGTGDRNTMLIEQRPAGPAPFLVKKLWREGIFNYWTETSEFCPIQDKDLSVRRDVQILTQDIPFFSLVSRVSLLASLFGPNPEAK